MFNGCHSLTTVPELPATTLESSCYAYMFRNCTGLTTAPELPSTTLASYCYQAMFYGCNSLESIDVSKFDTSKVTNMNNTFYSIYIRNLPQIDTSNVTDMRGICGWCRYLREIPLLNTSKVTRFSNAFMNCYSVSSGALALYNQISSQTTPPTDHSQAFADCGRDTTAGAAELAQIPSDWK
jgi:surface protein